MFDVIIVGGGMVGASMAVALQPLGLRVGLVEAFTFARVRSQPGYDDRSVALSYGSGQVYQGMGLWPLLQDQVAAIASIHISDRGYFGATRLQAAQEKVPALGYVVESRVLGGVLYDALQAGGTDIIAPAQVIRVEQQPGAVSVYIRQDDAETALSCRLLIVTDGADSQVRRQLGIKTREHDYQQSALIANVTTGKAHNNVAYERFTASGPLALLPMTANRYSLVWSHRSTEVEATRQLDDQAFLQKLQQAFGYRQGEFVKAGKRSVFPLKLVKSVAEVAGRAVLMGNASHSLHPVAGQGLNLALRDVAVMADLLAEAAGRQRDVGDSALLARYAQLRQPDFDSVVNYTDGLVRLFSNDFPLLGHVRAGGLLAVDRIKPLRGLLTRQSMGLRFRQARLARGLGLK